MPGEQPDHVQALLGDDQRAAVALDVTDLQQPLDDRRARRRRADPVLLHRLAQLLVVDELAGGLHRRQQRAVVVALRRLGLLALELDLTDVGGLALHELRQPLVAALVVVGGGVLQVGGLAVRATPTGNQQQLAAGAEHVTGDGRLDARVLEHRLGMEHGQEAPRDQVVDLAVILVELVDRVALGVGRDDRVVVGHLGVVDDPSQRQHVEPADVFGRGRGTRAAGRRAPPSA